jgi:hypothetical protein
MFQTLAVILLAVLSLVTAGLLVRTLLAVSGARSALKAIDSCHAVLVIGRQ